MNKHTKITLQELIRRKEQMLESRKKPKTGTLYIKLSLIHICCS